MRLQAILLVTLLGAGLSGPGADGDSVVPSALPSPRAEVAAVGRLDDVLVGRGFFESEWTGRVDYDDAFLYDPVTGAMTTAPFFFPPVDVPAGNYQVVWIGENAAVGHTVSGALYAHHLEQNNTSLLMPAEALPQGIGRVILVQDSSNIYTVVEAEMNPFGVAYTSFQVFRANLSTQTYEPVGLSIPLNITYSSFCGCAEILIPNELLVFSRPTAQNLADVWSFSLATYEWTNTGARFPVQTLEAGVFWDGHFILTTGQAFYEHESNTGINLEAAFLQSEGEDLVHVLDVSSGRKTFYRSEWPASAGLAVLEGEIFAFGGFELDDNGDKTFLADITRRQVPRSAPPTPDNLDARSSAANEILLSFGYDTKVGWQPIVEYFDIYRGASPSNLSWLRRVPQFQPATGFGTGTVDDLVPGPPTPLLPSPPFSGGPDSPEAPQLRPLYYAIEAGNRFGVSALTDAVCVVPRPFSSPYPNVGDVWEELGALACGVHEAAGAP